MIDYILHDEAQTEVDEAFERYRQDNPEAARRFLQSVDSQIAFIRTHPHAGTPVDRVHRVVKTARFPNEIYYRTRTSFVFIVAVAHEKRKPRYWKHR